MTKIFGIFFKVFATYLLYALTFLVLAPLMYAFNLVVALACALLMKDYHASELAVSVSECWREFCGVHRRVVRAIWESVS